MVILKTKEQLDKMRDSGYIASDVLNELKLNANPGVTTKYLNDKAETIIKQHRATPAFLGYKGFPFTICASINEEVIHGLPSDRELIDGDILSIDLGVVYKGWYSDTAITIPIGEVSERAEKLISITKESLYKAIDRSVPGALTGELSSIIQTHVEDNGFNVVRNYGGHGIGRDLHEDPRILNYKKIDAGIMLKTGMVIALEPITTENNPDNKAKGKWTVVTNDGGLSAHFEHTVAITDNGPEIFTERN